VHAASDLATVGPVDYVVAGTVAPSVSKAAGTPVLGPGGLGAIVAASAVPVYAIGGVTPADWRWIAGTGARGCAAIGAFLPMAGESAGDAASRAVRAFLDA
jgi:thiamine-phosphate pyrophosphorylase